MNDYDKALQRAKKALEMKSASTADMMKYIFPEIFLNESELTRRDIIKFLENCRDTTESAEVARNCSKWVRWLEEKAVSEWNEGFDRTLEQIARCIDYTEYHAEGLNIENYDPLYGFLKYVKKKLS